MPAGSLSHVCVPPLQPDTDSPFHTMVKETIAAEMEAFSLAHASESKLAILLHMITAFAKWQRRLIGVCNAIRVGLRDLVTRAQIHQPGASPFKDTAYGVYIASRLNMYARRLQNLPDADKEYDDFEASKLRELKLHSAIYGAPAAPAALARQAPATRGPAYAPGTRAPNAAPRAYERSADNDMARLGIMLHGMYAGQDMQGKCYVCTYVGSTPPGLPKHGSRHCPQAATGIAKMKMG